MKIEEKVREIIKIFRKNVADADKLFIENQIDINGYSEIKDMAETEAVTAIMALVEKGKVVDFDEAQAAVNEAFIAGANTQKVISGGQVNE